MLTAPSTAAACCTRRAVSLHFARHLATTQSLAAAEDDTRKKPRVTRKKYEDLPTGRVLADGKVSVPLGLLPGGIREPVVAYENTSTSIRARPSSQDNISFVLTSICMAVLCHVAPVKKTRSMSEDASSASSEPFTIGDGTEQPPKRRRGRPKKDAVEASALKPADAYTKHSEPPATSYHKPASLITKWPHIAEAEPEEIAPVKGV